MEAGVARSACQTSVALAWPVACSPQAGKGTFGWLARVRGVATAAAAAARWRRHLTRRDGSPAAVTRSCLPPSSSETSIVDRSQAGSERSQVISDAEQEGRSGKIDIDIGAACVQSEAEPAFTLACGELFYATNKLIRIYGYSRLLERNDIINGPWLARATHHTRLHPPRQVRMATEPETIAAVESLHPSPTSSPSQPSSPIDTCSGPLPSTIATQNLASTSKIQPQSPPQQPPLAARPRLKSIVVAPSPLRDPSPGSYAAAVLGNSGSIKKVRFNLSIPPTHGRPSSPSTGNAQNRKSCLRSALTAAPLAATGSHPVKAIEGHSIPTSRGEAAHPPAASEAHCSRREVISEELEGWTTTESQCAIFFNSSNHQASFATHPEQWQNLAHECSRGGRAERRGAVVLPCSPATPPLLDDTSFPPLPRSAMSRPGDAATRPMEAFAVASSTGDMERELERLSLHAVVAWLGKGRPVVGSEVIKRAFCSYFAVRQDDITVVRHYPEDYLIDFKHRHHRDAAVAQRDFPCGNLDIRIRPWQLLTHGDLIDLKFHVRLCLEGVPLHAWNESIAKRVVATTCNLDYVEEQSLRKEDTRAINLWAWTSNPSDIPKVTWLTLTGRSMVVHDGMVPPSNRDKSGLTFRWTRMVAPPVHDYTWHYGVIDGERVPRDHRDPAPRDHHDKHNHGNDDDDDYDDDRRPSRALQRSGSGSALNQGGAITGTGLLQPEDDGTSSRSIAVASKLPGTSFAAAAVNAIIIDALSDVHAQSPVLFHNHVELLTETLEIHMEHGTQPLPQAAAEPVLVSTSSPLQPPPEIAANAPASLPQLQAATNLEETEVAPATPAAPAAPAASDFISNITKQLEQPLLQHQQPEQQAAPRRTKKNAGLPTRKSVRLAALSWPRGHALNRARQVLMKRLGIVQEEDESREETLVRYINLFKGPLTDLVIKALAALSGLDGHLHIWGFFAALCYDNHPSSAEDASSLMYLSLFVVAAAPAFVSGRAILYPCTAIYGSSSDITFVAVSIVLISDRIFFLLFGRRSNVNARLQRQAVHCIAWDARHALSLSLSLKNSRDARPEAELLTAPLDALFIPPNSR
nr:unnamed protein product [Digitaria exilis]